MTSIIGTGARAVKAPCGSCRKRAGPEGAADSFFSAATLSTTSTTLADSFAIEVSRFLDAPERKVISASRLDEFQDKASGAQTVPEEPGETDLQLRELNPCSVRQRRGGSRAGLLLPSSLATAG